MSAYEICNAVLKSALENILVLPFRHTVTNVWILIDKRKLNVLQNPHFVHLGYACAMDSVFLFDLSLSIDDKCWQIIFQRNQSGYKRQFRRAYINGGNRYRKLKTRVSYERGKSLSKVKNSDIV